MWRAKNVICMLICIACARFEFVHVGLPFACGRLIVRSYDVSWCIICVVVIVRGTTTFALFLPIGPVAVAMRAAFG
jgi:hypothetical protein